MDQAIAPLCATSSAGVRRVDPIEEVAAVQEAFEAEQTPWDFYDGALKQAEDPAVQELFVDLRDEEVRHQQIVRERMERLPSGPGPDLEADETGTDPGTSSLGRSGPPLRPSPASPDSAVTTSRASPRPP